MIFVGAFITFYIAVIMVMYLSQRKLMYHPNSNLDTPLSHGIPEVVPIKLVTSDDLTITSWFKASGTNKPFLIYFHGNAGHIGDRATKVCAYLEAGYGILLVGYRGYGGNPGKPTEQGLYKDAATALDFLLRSGVAPDQWVLYGESLGTAIAIEMAARFSTKTPVAGVVLEAPFSSMADAAGALYPYLPTKILIKDEYDSKLKITTIKSPIMVVHGDMDKTIPQKLGIKLFDAANEPKSSLWINGAGHNNLYDFGMDQEVISFIDKNWPRTSE